MHTTAHGKTTPPVSEEIRKQEPFSRVAPMLKTALLMGAGGGFLLAAFLALTRAFPVPLGAWWEVAAQAHGHLQLYGWAGLFVLGVALHFLPRLRGTPLAGARLVPWLLGILTVAGERTLWLGNAAAVLRVGSLLFAPLFGAYRDSPLIPSSSASLAHAV